MNDGVVGVASGRARVGGPQRADDIAFDENRHVIPQPHTVERLELAGDQLEHRILVQPGEPPAQTLGKMHERLELSRRIRAAHVTILHSQSHVGA